LGLGLGLVALVYFSRDLEIHAFAQSWRKIRILPYLEGIAWFCFSFWLRCPRWGILVGGMGKVPLTLISQAFFVGMLVNRLFPARLGEIARCVILKKGRMLSLVGLLTTVAVEKAYDGLALLSMSLIALTFIPSDDLPPGLAYLINHHRYHFVGGVLCLPFLLLVITWLLPWIDQRLQRQGQALPLRHYLHHAVQAISNGLNSLRKRGETISVLALTALVWITLSRSAYCAILSFGFALPPSAGIVLCAAIGLAVTLPQAPSFVGVYQVAVQWTLVGLYAVPLQEAKAFAVAIWFVQIVPVGIIGFICLRLLGTTLTEVCPHPSPHGSFSSEKEIPEKKV
jgi:uncharacterized membrane protein YbhN (UPF0104 family)